SSKSLTQHFENLINRYTGNIDLRLAAEYMLDNQFESHLENYENKPLTIAEDYLLVETSYPQSSPELSSNNPKNKEKGIPHYPCTSRTLSVHG
ncbi:MAG: hypothetical protein LBK58_01645, partial [Prevotellaceae bacterium]|nr:hypothetical protein [Prevotellaceae bacterium]